MIPRIPAVIKKADSRAVALWQRTGNKKLSVSTVKMETAEKTVRAPCRIYCSV